MRIPIIKDLVEGRRKLQEYYAKILRKTHNESFKLRFTLDGNLVGDLGEALAAEHFGIKLVDTKSTVGIDGYAPDGVTTVQVKATGTGRGPAFRNTETRADHLLFFQIDFEVAEAIVVYNGPEHYAVSLLPKEFANQRSLTAKQIRDADAMVPDEERLPRI
ncbi:hypothetical protein B5P45_25185 [Phyllobacterium zundukense]|uniref:DUF6998 domain-containing protein n=1 Tax=Phyllobacterium zundukense TaxID=1867719 RepID=A0A2N9VSY8_9HYPH|nr:hypothetical protein BLM14_14725 [Phyllobacterium zundukense]PIO42606.1 hypothetical protein B5P45_25185 [Phyllobacterium zundukense]